MTPLEEILRKSLTNTAKQFFPFLQHPLYALILMENKKMACYETANKEV